MERTEVEGSFSDEWREVEPEQRWTSWPSMRASTWSPCAKAVEETPTPLRRSENRAVDWEERDMDSRKEREGSEMEGFEELIPIPWEQAWVHPAGPPASTYPVTAGRSSRFCEVRYSTAAGSDVERAWGWGWRVGEYPAAGGMSGVLSTREGRGADSSAARLRSFSRWPAAATFPGAVFFPFPRLGVASEGRTVDGSASLWTRLRWRFIDETRENSRPHRGHSAPAPPSCTVCLCRASTSDRANAAPHSEHTCFFTLTTLASAGEASSAGVVGVNRGVSPICASVTPGSACTVSMCRFMFVSRENVVPHFVHSMLFELGICACVCGGVGVGVGG